MDSLSVELVLSVASFGVTIYFWLIQARRERPQLKFFQIAGFRAACRRHPERSDAKRLCVQQIDSCGVLVANNSIRQNSIVLFDCWLLLPDGQQIVGDWGTVGEDQPPWNVGPESTISLGLACFFDVPPEFEVPEQYEIGITFVSASGARFSHVFASAAPVAKPKTERFRRAA